MRHLGFVFAAACLALAATPACSHAIIVGSDPLPGATVAPGPARVVLRFNSKIDQGRSRLELRGGPLPVVLPLAAAASPDEMAADADLQPGRWSLRWQVLAVDGHLTRGDVPFTVAPPPADPTPQPSLQPSQASASKAP